MIFSLLAQSAHAELESLTPLELYNSSELILVGKVISIREDPVQHETEYDIKVEQYLKNPKPYSLITVVGSGTKSAPTEDDPLFDQGDRVLLYLNKHDEKYRISPFSFKATSSCDPSSLLDLDLSTIPGQRPPSGIAGGPIRITDIDGNESNFFRPKEKAVINYEAFNSHPHNETFNLQIFITEINKTESIFEQEQQITLDACDGHMVTWNINPIKVGDYEVKVIFDEKTDVYSFAVRQNVGCCGSDKSIYPIIESPLKQFKNDFDFKKIKCNDGLQLLFKTSNGLPACVKPSSVKRLSNLHWGTISEHYPNRVKLDIVKPETVVIRKNQTQEITVIVPESFVANITHMSLDYISFQDYQSKEIMMPIDGFKENERVVEVGIKDLRYPEYGSQNKIVLPIFASDDTKKGTYTINLLLFDGKFNLIDSFKIQVQ